MFMFFMGVLATMSVIAGLCIWQFLKFAKNWPC